MKELLDLIDGRSVAVVGNGTPETDESAVIDSSDVVIRLNHFYNYESGRVGKRVDAIVQTFTSAWIRAKEKHADIIREQSPRIFCGKKPEQYHPDEVAKFLGPVCVSDISPDLAPYAKFTTGTALLLFLASARRNASFTIHGFPSGEQADKYFETDARHYRPIKDEELRQRDAAIEILKRQRVYRPRSVPERPAIVIPVRRGSTGAPGKNAALLPRLLDKLEAAKIVNPIWVVGNDGELLDSLASRPGVSTYLTPDGLDGEVTDVLRVWRDQTEYSGEVVLVQCTAPRFKVEWLDELVKARRHAPVAATCVRVKFKVSALFANAGGCWSQLVTAFGAPSVPRQQLPEVVRLSGAAFAFHSDALSRASFYQAGTLSPVIVDEADALDVDTVDDLKAALMV